MSRASITVVEALDKGPELPDHPRTSRSSHVSEPTDDEIERRNSINARKRTRVVLAAFYFFFFTLGLNAGSTGPLLPSYQAKYHVNFLIVSMLFISNCLGCLASALINVFIGRRIAFSKILIAASLLPILGYSLMASGPPFPVMCASFFLNGIGLSLLNTQCNFLLSVMQDTPAMGYAHASFGTGALIAPIASSRFGQMPRWTFYYFILLGAVLLDLVSFTAVFRGKGHDEVLKEMGTLQETELQDLSAEAAIDPQQAGDSTYEEGTPRSFVSKNWHAALFAAFLFVYVGIEVTIGGWIVTFLLHERGAGTSSAYVSTGFYAGLALGRIALMWVNRKVGERNAVFIYAAIAIGLEITVWLVPSLIENAVAVAFVGVMLGPIFPIVMSTAGRIIPRQSLASSIGWISASGQAGSAVLPFATGALANKYGIIALQPLIVAMMCTMIGLWVLVPRVSKRTE